MEDKKVMKTFLQSMAIDHDTIRKLCDHADLYKKGVIVEEEKYIPPIWQLGYDSDKWLEMAMHLVGHGVISSILELTELVLTGFRARSHICDHSNNKPPCKLAISWRYCELVAVGHRFGKVSVLATTPSQIRHEKLEWTSHAARLKFKGRLVQINISFIGGAIVAVVRS